MDTSPATWRTGPWPLQCYWRNCAKLLPNGLSSVVIRSLALSRTVSARSLLLSYSLFWRCAPPVNKLYCVGDTRMLGHTSRMLVCIDALGVGWNAPKNNLRSWSDWSVDGAVLCKDFEICPLHVWYMYVLLQKQQPIFQIACFRIKLMREMINISSW